MLTTFALVLLFSGTVSAAKKNAELPNAVNYEPLRPNIGPPPSIDPNDYAAYKPSVPGTATLFGTDAGITLTNGTLFFCKADDVFLYPDTPYTEWMIAQWALRIDGREAHQYPLYPGLDPDEPAPPWLRVGVPSNDEANNVVRTTGCEQGRFAFKNVPVGKYLFVAMITHYGGAYSSSESSGESRTVMSPVGPVLVEGATHSVGGFKPSDDFVAVARTPIVITAKDNYYELDPKAVKVVARTYEAR